jgi:hypothetical protein
MGRKLPDQLDAERVDYNELQRAAFYELAAVTSSPIRSALKATTDKHIVVPLTKRLWARRPICLA